MVPLPPSASRQHLSKRATPSILNSCSCAITRRIVEQADEKEKGRVSMGARGMVEYGGKGGKVPISFRSLSGRNKETGKVYTTSVGRHPIMNGTVDGMNHVFHNI